MKVVEIISEAKKGSLRKSVVKAATRLATWPELDNGNVPYLQYRFGVAAAVSPGGQIEPSGPIAGALTTIAYTPEDEKILIAAGKLLGASPVRISGDASEELDTTNIKSPVAKPKRNKYGV